MEVMVTRRKGGRQVLLRFFLRVWLTYSCAVLAFMWPPWVGVGESSEVKQQLGQELQLCLVFLGLLGGEGFKSVVKRQK